MLTQLSVPIAQSGHYESHILSILMKHMHLGYVVDSMGVNMNQSNHGLKGHKNTYSSN
jgi:hypothetical protein